MGQIFNSCAYDIDAKKRCVYDADKFHANCYAHSGSVLSIHYLLRQKPYNVMWGGGYVVLDDGVQYFSRLQDLLGLSTYLTYDDFERNNKELANKSYYENVKFIDESSKQWEKIDVWDEAKKYFNVEKTHSVKYSGYLLNHTKKLAVNLADYYERSKGSNSYKSIVTIDAIPVLTETGGGTMMALFEGASFESTEKLIGIWCGDLLQIADELPEGYGIIDCCFAEIWYRARYCYNAFGVDKDGYILKNGTGERYQSVSYSISQKRSPAMYIKVNKVEGGIEYVTEFMSEEDAEAVKAQNKKANIEQAKNLKTKGTSVDIISLITKLSKEEIDAL